MEKIKTDLGEEARKPRRRHGVMYASPATAGVYQTMVGGLDQLAKKALDEFDRTGDERKKEISAFVLGAFMEGINCGVWNATLREAQPKPRRGIPRKRK